MISKGHQLRSNVMEKMSLAINQPLLNNTIYMSLNRDCPKQMSNEALLKYDAVLRLNKSCSTPEVCMIKTHGDQEGDQKGHYTVVKTIVG